MANYYCVMRTNYFRVKDEEKFLELMENVCSGEDELQIWSETDAEGAKRFGFGAYDSIRGINLQGDQDEDPDYDAFITALQDCVADDDAIIIMEAGHEKLCYVGGSAEVITSQGHDYINITDSAVKMAKEMLNAPDWATKCDY
jgi:hypothetical protein